MANEGVIKFSHPVSGLATLTAQIRKPDDTLRDAQSAEALDDSTHDSLYSNAGAITIETGDSVIIDLVGTPAIGGGEYQPESSVSDKTGFSLSTAGVLAIWHQLTAAVVTASTMGKLVIDFLNATITSRATSAKQDTMETTLGLAATESNVNSKHSTTDGKIDFIQSDITLVKAETDLLDGMIIEDSAGNQFTVAALRNAPTAEMDADELAIEMKAITGLAVSGGTWTWEKIMRITTAWIAGNWRLKTTDANVQELMDAENGTTIILEQQLTRRPGAGNDYRNITVKI